MLEPVRKAYQGLNSRPARAAFMAVVTLAGAGACVVAVAVAWGLVELVQRAMP